jgi:hypothetical protein
MDESTAAFPATKSNAIMLLNAAKRAFVFPGEVQPGAPLILLSWAWVVILAFSAEVRLARSTI